jgi:hypothetical protein
MTEQNWGGYHKRTAAADEAAFNASGAIDWETMMGDFATPQGRRRACLLGGLLYLGIIAGGVFAEAIVRQGVLVSGDPQATASNILANEGLYRAGFGVSLIFLAFNVPLLLVFFQLLRHVNENLALLMAFFFVVACSVEVMNVVNHLNALEIHSYDPDRLSLTSAQIAAIGYLSLQSFNTGFGVALVYFGFYFLLLGYLIIRSRFLPAFVGALLILAGAGYLTNSFVLFLLPSLSSLFFPWVLLPALVGELTIALWLLFKGVDERYWPKTPLPEA